MDGFARLDLIYRGSQFATEANLTETGEAVVANVRVGVRTETYSLEAYVTNLLDQDALPSAQVGIDVITFEQNEFRANLPDRRRFGVRATYNF